MKKIKILVIPSDRTGVGAHRSLTPHITLENQYPDLFSVDIDYEPKINDIKYWDKYQIIHVHRNIGSHYDQTPSIIKYLKSIGKVVIVDIDDYWLPTVDHPIHSIIVQNKIHEKIVANLKEADWVTTTTDIFANEIRKFTFSSDTYATLGVTLTQSKYYLAGMANSGTAGYFAGGQFDGSLYSTVDKVTFSSDTKSTLGTGLSGNRDKLAGMANSGVL
jgi:hypothetical protein